MRPGNGAYEVDRNPSSLGLLGDVLIGREYYIYIDIIF